METNIPDSGKQSKWWLCVALFLLVMMLLLFGLKRCMHRAVEPQPAEAPVESVAPVEAPAPVGIRDMGHAISITLPDGTEWAIDKNSSEYQLFAFLNSADAKVDEDKTKGWITMTALHFDRNSTYLSHDDEIDAQLGNVAAILKFFPDSQIKIGGYTDNTGTDEINMKISSERAQHAAESLIALGIAENRVTHEGFGPHYPVCPANDTDECMAANRRIDIRVTQK
jgi:outer membrane protein OmpA-like peptidoglycan-associated protein